MISDLWHVLQVDTDDEAATLLPLQTEMVELARRYAGMVRSAATCLPIAASGVP